MSYKTQGYISEVDLIKETFTLEPTAPYVFEKRNTDGTAEKLIMFVTDLNKRCSTAHLVKNDVAFHKSNICAATLVAIKHAHDKVEVDVKKLNASLKSPLAIENMWLAK